jgi:hypothetical protein
VDPRKAALFNQVLEKVTSASAESDPPPAAVESAGAASPAVESKPKGRKKAKA